MVVFVVSSVSCRHSHRVDLPLLRTSAEIVVAQDGTGDFRTIQAALDSVSRENTAWRYILIKNGTYHEKLYVTVSHVAIVGEDRDRTRIVYSELRKSWRKEHSDDWGAAVVNIGDNVSDLVLANLTVHNNYGSLHGDDDHQFAIRSGGQSTRISLIHVAIIADGGDTLSLWNAENGLYYHNDCYFEGYVDFVCPRGKNYITNSTFYAQPSSAAIWHDGSKDPSHKLVIRHSWFDGVPGFPLGRNHRDGQFFLLDNTFAWTMADKPIYQPPAPQPVIWGERYYYWDNHRVGSDYAWFRDNLQHASGAPTAAMIGAKWTFGGQWDPENTLPPVLPFASIPRPEHTSSAVDPDNPELRWLPARNSVRQRIFFGTTASPSLRKEQREAVFHPGRLHPATTYYWRVDSVRPSGTISGQLWRFTTSGAAVAPSIADSHSPRRPLHITLFGGSTAADDEDWARGFKQYFGERVECNSFAMSGGDSKSYLDEGIWKKALAEKSDYILIQFGERESDLHGASLQYLTRYIAQARASGKVPVVITPPSRHHFDMNGVLDDDLWEYAQAVRQLAVEQQVALIDLHMLSAQMLRKIGPQSREKFGFKKPDGSLNESQLNDEGSPVFGNLVAEELTKVVPEFAEFRRDAVH